jgi:hypothetical protein
LIIFDDFDKSNPFTPIEQNISIEFSLQLFVSLVIFDDFDESNPFASTEQNI